MKKRLFFVVMLVILLNSIAVIAQDGPYSRKMQIGDERELKRYLIDNEQAIFSSAPFQKSFLTDNANTLNAIIPDFQVNENTGIGDADQYQPSISLDGNGNFVITWTDERNGNGDIYAQCYASDGTKIGTNFKVNDDQETDYPMNDQRNSCIATDCNGNFVITWMDYRNHNKDIYAQRYASGGTAIGTNFKVNDNVESAWTYFPSISADSNGNFIITWADDRCDWDYDIYAQRYTSDGTAIGSNFRVNESGWYDDNYSPSICTDMSGNFVITWRDWYDEWWWNNNIYAKRYAHDGTAIGSNFIVNLYGDAQRYGPSISIDGSGNFIITWVNQGFEHGSSEWYDSDIFAQRYASNGTTIGSNYIVNEDICDFECADQYSPSISTDSSGNFVITWADERYGDPNIYAQRYASDGSAVGSNYRVTNISTTDQTSPDVCLWNDRIYTTWRDNSAGTTGYDIWANVLDWENPIGIRDKELSQVPLSYRLLQNYPNPFNTETTFRYQLQADTHVKLIIYNAVGELVFNLINEQQREGSHRAKCNGRNQNGDIAGTGIYFARFETEEFIDVKKIMLIK